MINLLKAQAPQFSGVQCSPVPRMPMFSGVSLTQPLQQDAVQFGNIRRPFPKSGVGNIHLYQGALPDCQTLSSLYALSRNPAGSKLLESMISGGEEGKYTVTFPGHPDSPIEVTLDELKQKPDRKQTIKAKNGRYTMTLNGTRSKTFRIKADSIGAGDEIEVSRKARAVGGGLGVRLIERAFAKLNIAAYPAKYDGVTTEDPLQVFFHKNYHSNPMLSLRDITGWRSRQLIAGKSFSESKGFAAEFKNKPGLKEETLALLDKLAANPDKFAVVVGTKERPKNSKASFLRPGDQVNPYHDYAVEKIDPQAKTVTVRNPHNTRIPQTFTYNDFFKFFYVITYAQVPKAQQ